MVAGRGTRMKSATCKVLHFLAGRPLVYFPIQAAVDAGATELVVVASPDTRDDIERVLRDFFSDHPVKMAVQEVPRGTGDAARVGLLALSGESTRVAIVSGDTPLITAEDLKALLHALEGGSELAIASCVLSDPTGYGRILRDADGGVTGVREHADLTGDQASISEINAGLYCGNVHALTDAVGRLSSDNAQGELYLTDVVQSIARQAKVEALHRSPDVMVGVNDRVQLAAAEQALYRRHTEWHRRRGVTVRGDARIDAGVEIGADATLEAGVRLRGKTRIGGTTVVDVGCVLTNAVVGEGVSLKPYSVVTDSQVDAGAQIGPFAHLRPGSIIGKDAHIGNFVETKKTHVREGAKANHLAYLGDGDVGPGANIGAGTIFCNYDGFMKHKTVIGAGAFIGSDSQLVAPVTVGAGAYVATATCVTMDVPSDGLAIGRARQSNKEGYGRILREQLAAKKKR